MTIRYAGSVGEMRSALRIIRNETPSAGTVSSDELNRRRMQRRLREAEMRSLRRQILGGGYTA